MDVHEENIRNADKTRDADGKLNPYRRKTVSNSLAHALGSPKERIEQVLRDSGLDPGCRAEEISPEDFVELCEKFSS